MAFNLIITRAKIKEVKIKIPLIINDPKYKLTK